MAFQLLIPAALGPAFAAGEITLMSTAAGATTTLVGTSGTIVGTATLVPAASATAGGVTVVAGSGGAAGATAAAAASTLVLPIALAVGGALLIGGGCYLLYRGRRSTEQAGDPVVLDIPEGVEVEAALREAQEIVDREYRRLTDSVPRPLVGLREVGPSGGPASLKAVLQLPTDDDLQSRWQLDGSPRSECIRLPRWLTWDSFLEAAGQAA